MIYKKVNTADRLPEKRGVYTTDIGEIPFRDGKFLWGIADGKLYEMPEHPEYWLEPIDLPSEADIESGAWFYSGYAGVQSRSNRFSFVQGGLWMLSEIKNR